MARIYYAGKGLLEEADFDDAEVLAKKIRLRELLEMGFYEGSESVLERLQTSLISSRRAWTYMTRNGEPLIMCGVCDIEENKSISRRLGLVSGRGGIPWALSSPAASSYKFDAVRHGAPIVFAGMKEGYDFLSCWVAGWMNELFKITEMFGFRKVERAEYKGHVLFRIEWRRENG